jgi:glycosyltransferase involved in cell wall biosynthesis
MNQPDKYPSVTVLICALNEEGNLPFVLPKIPGWINEILLVDGHSSDNTTTVAKQLRPEIKILFQPNKGKGDALKYGIQQASSDIIVTLDADGSTNPEDLPRFLSPLLNGYNFAKGTRLAHGRPPNMARHRWIGNKILAITSNILIGTKYTDICSGYNAFWRSAFMNLNLNHNGFEMEQEMLIKAKKAGLKVVEVYHNDSGRLGNSSKVSVVKQGLLDWMIIIRECFRRG